MDEEVQRNIHHAMEVLDQDLSQRDSKTDQRNQNQTDLSDKATDPPMNHGDGVGMLQGLPGPSSKAKAQVKRSRKRTDILVILRESLHRESKSIAKEKIRNAIRDKRTQYSPIVKKSRRRLGSRIFRKRYMPKKKNIGVAKKKTVQEKMRKKTMQQRVLRLSPVSCDSESSVSASQHSSIASTESCKSESTASRNS